MKKVINFETYCETWTKGYLQVKEQNLIGTGDKTN